MHSPFTSLLVFLTPGVGGGVTPLPVGRVLNPDFLFRDNSQDDEEDWVAGARTPMCSLNSS